MSSLSINGRSAVGPENLHAVIWHPTVDPDSALNRHACLGDLALDSLGYRSSVCVFPFPLLSHNPRQTQLKERRLII